MVPVTRLSVFTQVMEGGDFADALQDLSFSACNSRVLRDESNFIQNVGQFYNQEDISDVILKVSYPYMLACLWLLLLLWLFMLTVCPALQETRVVYYC